MQGFLQIGVLFQGYVPERLIGAGGFSEVYAVRHRFLGHVCAMKAIKLQTHSERVRSLAQAEAIALSRLRHENLVQVFDAGISEGGILWMTMPLLEGMTLRELLHKTSRLPVVEALRIARDVSDGVQAAHEMGIVHRDLKPENVFVTARREVIVFDLGMAKFSGFGLESTGAGRRMGTLRYMSPEQLRGDRVDGRSDVYQIGCLLDEMLRGEHAFHWNVDRTEALANEQVGFAHLNRTPVPIAALRPEVPAEVVAIVERAFAKDREARFQTVVELGQAIRGARKRLLAAEEGSRGAAVERPSEPGARSEYLAPRAAPVPFAAPKEATARVVVALPSAQNDEPPEAARSAILPGEGPSAPAISSSGTLVGGRQLPAYSPTEPLPAVPAPAHASSRETVPMGTPQPFDGRAAPRGAPGPAVQPAAPPASGRSSPFVGRPSPVLERPSPAGRTPEPTFQPSTPERPPPAKRQGLGPRQVLAGVGVALIATAAIQAARHSGAVEAWLQGPAVAAGEATPPAPAREPASALADRPVEPSPVVPPATSATVAPSSSASVRPPLPAGKAARAPLPDAGAGFRDLPPEDRPRF
jgi:serine/threonine-protein kinase